MTHTVGPKSMQAEHTLACMGVSVQAWQAHLHFHVAWMQAPLCAPRRGTLGVSSASGSQHKLRWPLGVWGWYASGGRAHVCTPMGTHTIIHSQALPQLLRVIRRAQGPEVLLQGGHCQEKGTGIRSRRTPADQVIPRLQGACPAPSRSRARSPRTWELRPGRPQSDCHSPAPAPHRPVMPPAEPPRQGPLPGPSDTGPQAPSSRELPLRASP